ncbi:MAG: LuxR C-terminal-related transcriptional regulator [Candidatus Zixiibacteriota bacterium]
MSCGVLAVNTEFRPLFANRALCQMVQMDRSRLMQLRCYQAWPGPQCHSSGCPVHRVPACDTHVVCEVDKRCVLGGLKAYWVTATALRGPHDTILGVVNEVTEVPELQLAALNTVILRTRLEAEQGALTNMEAVLRQLASQVDTGRRRVEQKVASHLNRVVFPLLRQASAMITGPKGGQLAAIEAGLKDTIPCAVDGLDSRLTALSPRELQICSLVRQGLRSKEIAQALGVAEGTVEQQRKRIRRKLGLKNRRHNLVTHLKLKT